MMLGGMSLCRHSPNQINVCVASTVQRTSISTVAPATGRALGSSILQLNSSSKGWGACEGRRDDQFERAGDAVPQTEYL
jgi:hypothetical protein